MTRVSENIKHKEELKSLMSKFKKDCLEEKKLYDSQLEILEKKVSKLSDTENTQVFEEIDRNYQNEYEKLLLKKKDLFEQNKIINLLTRKIQVCPSKLELIQYQRRFQELYDQINQISERSKNILNDLNAKDEIKRLLNQKVSINLHISSRYSCSSKIAIKVQSQKRIRKSLKRTY
jgi:hypothetical protein